jgi:hypothetical protein
VDVSRARFISPGLASLRSSPPAGEKWQYELKFDGYRVQLHKAAGGTATTFGKNGGDLTRRFPTIATAVLALPVRSCVIDGEPIAAGEHDQPDFLALLHGRRVPVCVYAFDLLTRDVGPVQELIPGLVEKGILTIFAGPGGVHKSRTGVHWGLSLAAGVAIERCAFVYLSYEDHFDSVTRRVQQMAARLNLPIGDNAHYWDLRRSGKTLAAITDAAVEPQPFWQELVGYLKAIPGHKFVLVDGT